MKVQTARVRGQSINDAQQQIYYYQSIFKLINLTQKRC